MLTTITYPQLLEWWYYDQLDPFGGVRGDVQAGVIASTLANINRDTKRKPDPFTVQDFVVDFAGVKDGEAAKGGAKPAARTPITSPSQWRSVMSMAKAYAGATSPTPTPKRRRNIRHAPTP